MQRVERKLVGSDARVAETLDRQIEVLEQNGDPESVLSGTDLRTLGIMGHADYLAHLKKVRHSMNDVGSEE